MCKINRQESLRNLRIVRDISAEEMAKLLGLKTAAAYYKKESGVIKISLAEAKLISEKLNMSIEDIFFNDQVSDMETDSSITPTGTEGQ